MTGLITSQSSGLPINPSESPQTSGSHAFRVGYYNSYNSMFGKKYGNLFTTRGHRSTVIMVMLVFDIFVSKTDYVRQKSTSRLRHCKNILIT